MIVTMEFANLTWIYYVPAEVLDQIYMYEL